MAAAQSAKSTVEQITNAGNSAFKDAVDKSLTALNDVNAHSKKNLEAVIASVTAAAKGAEALTTETLAYSKTAMENQVAAAKSLSSVKSVQELFELQSGFAKTAMESYMTQMGKVSEIMTASMKDAVKPINERVTATVEAFQAAR
ncbi:MAG: phasin family protein [Alphaproteobacteria bacterium PA2]|nr:MAG: phasin family protein [Alphaproteobacteria bacterium PA2]